MEYEDILLEPTSVQKHRQTFLRESLGLPGLVFLGHNIFNRAVSPLNMHIHKGMIEMVVIIKGDETYFVDDMAYELTGGDVFVTYVSQPHGSGSRTQGNNEMIWFLIDPFAENLFDQSPNKADVLRSHLLSINHHRLKADNECIIMLKKSVESYLKFNESHQQYAAQLFVCFLYRLLFMQQDLSQNDSVMNQALEYIEKNICNTIELEDLSNLCGMSLSGFKLKFKQFTGKTPRDYINIRKISKSKEQLQNGKMITETAMELGFNSSDYFSYVFKKYMAISPSQFVKQYAKKLPVSPSG